MARAKEGKLRRRIGPLAAVLLGAAALGVTAPGLLAVGSAPQTARPSSTPSEGSSPIAEALRDALEQVKRLQSEVDAGRVVPRFGERSGRLVAAEPKLESVVDGMLHGLFLRQLAILERQAEASVEGRTRPTAAHVARAEARFAAKAAELVRPNSTWDYEAEKEALHVSLRQALRDNTAIVKERARSAQTQRAVTDVIRNMQKQMEHLGEKLRGTGAASPWVLWTSYRLPGTPIQVSGRYEQGRTNIEFNLSPNQDPANAEAGFVEGLTPQNLGLSLNIGV